MLKFSSPLHEATIIKRYKRFFVDATLKSSNALITGHCPNTGTLKSCYREGATIFLSHTNVAERKLKYTWEYTQIPEGLIGINTMRPNAIVAEGITAGLIPELSEFDQIQREVRYGENSRIDIFLSHSKNKKQTAFVEIKNATLRVDDAITFPDAVTTRGQKHLEELMRVVKSGTRAVMLYLVNRPDGSYFTPADDIDPTYAKLLRQAHKKGVELLAYRAASTLEGSQIGDKIEIRL